jgi:hypothetical protein
MFILSFEPSLYYTFGGQNLPHIQSTEPPMHRYPVAAGKHEDFTEPANTNAFNHRDRANLYIHTNAIGYRSTIIASSPNKVRSGPFHFQLPPFVAARSFTPRLPYLDHLDQTKLITRYHDVCMGCCGGSYSRAACSRI